MSKLLFSTTINNNYSVIPTSLVQATNGDYIIVGRVFDSFPNSSAFALRINSGGMTIWHRTYNCPFTQFFSSITKVADGNFVATGIYSYSNNFEDQYLWVVKINQLGKIIWQHAIGDLSSLSGGTDVCATSDGGFIVSSTLDKNETPQTRVLKFDADNNLQWDNFYNIGFAYSIIETMDGGYALSGASLIPGSLNSNLFIERIDSNGKILWERVYTEYSIYALLHCGIVETKNGHFAIAAKSVIMEVDSIGNIVISQYNEEYSLDSILETENGNFNIAGSIIVNNHDYGYVAQIDRNTLNILSDNTEIGFSSKLTHSILDANSFLVSCGYINLNDKDTIGLVSVFYI